MLDRNRSVLEVSGKLLLLLTLPAVILLYGFTQPPIVSGDGHPYDSQSYYHMAEQVAAGERIEELRPFASRVALPWLVGKLFPADLMLGFTVLNIAFALGGLLLLGLFLREFLRSEWLVWSLLLLTVVNPNSPVRFVFYLPAYTDPPALFFITLLLLLNRRIATLNLRTALVFATAGFVGALFRELVLCAVLVTSFCQCASLSVSAPWLRLKSFSALGLALVPVAATLAGIWLANAAVESTGSYQYLVQAQRVITQLVQQPTIYPLAWLTAFGLIPVIILLRLNHRLLGFLGANQDILLYLLGLSLLALVAGFHTDRLVLWAYPAVLVVFGKVLECLPWRDTDRLRKVLFFGPLVLVQTLTFRVFLPIPGDEGGQLFDPGAAPALLFSAYGEAANLGHFYASSMVPGDRITLLIQFALMAVYFGALLATMSRGHKKV
jgi:hypothetical protein